MKIGLNIGYWTASPPLNADELVLLADSLGYDSVWTAEAYGADALLPLAWWGSATNRIRLGSAIAQMSARTPTATAMAAMTMDHLSGGRFTLGLGASGPQVVEGWHGVPYSRPLARTREYVDIVRAVLERSKPVQYEGTHFQIPYPGGTGLGKPLRSIVHPVRNRIPILLAAEGPRNIELSAEIADGWIPFFFDPDTDAAYRGLLDQGFAKRDPALGSDFEVMASVFMALDDDVTAAIDRLRPTFSLYIGGMGARTANFHRNVFDRMGYHRAVEQVSDRYAAGDRRGAERAVPTELIERCALVGPAAQIADTIRTRWAPTVVDTICVTATPEEARTLATALRLRV